MKLWIITKNNKPTRIDGNYILGKTKRETIETFLYSEGFTWRERDKGIESTKINVGE